MAFVQIPLSNTLRMVRTDNQSSNLANFDNRLLQQEDYVDYYDRPYAQKINSSDNILIQFATDYTLTKAYTDWFLPSLDLLSAIYNNLKLKGIGDIASTSYWSSSEISDTSAAFVNMSTGNQGSTQKSNSTYRVRACREFTASTGDYNLGDTGPAGGFICYINGTTYYEAAPSDQSIGQAWSNITTVLIGTTGTAIGTGQANTTAIINQAGHTDSAALLCDNLSIVGTGITAKVYNILDELISDETSNIVSNLVSTSFTIFDLNFTIAPIDYYYLVISFDDGTELYQSEIFEIYSTANENILKIEYNTSENDGIVYNNSQTFILRLEGRLVEYEAGQEKETYTNYNESLVNLNSYPTRQFTLEYGPVPRYMAEKLNLALAHEVFKVNDVEYQTKEGSDAELIKEGLDVTNLYKGNLKLQQVTYEDYTSIADDVEPTIYPILIDETDQGLILSDLGVEYYAKYR